MENVDIERNIKNENVLEQMAKFDFNVPIKFNIIFDDGDDEIMIKEEVSIFGDDVTATIKEEHSQIEIDQISTTIDSIFDAVNKSEQTQTTNLNENLTLIDKTMNSSKCSARTEESDDNNNNKKTKRKLDEKLFKVDEKVKQNKNNVTINNIKKANKNNKQTNHNIEACSNTSDQIPTNAYSLTLIRTVGQYLIRIINEYHRFKQTTSMSVSENDVTEQRNQFLRLKYHFFNLSYDPVVNVILPQMRNQSFVKKFVNDTVHFTIPENRTERIRTEILLILLELIKWTEQKTSTINRIKNTSTAVSESNPLLKQYLNTPTIIPNISLGTIELSSVYPRGSCWPTKHVAIEKPKQSIQQSRQLMIFNNTSASFNQLHSLNQNASDLRNIPVSSGKSSLKEFRKHSNIPINNPCVSTGFDYSNYFNENAYFHNLNVVTEHPKSFELSRQQIDVPMNDTNTNVDPNRSHFISQNGFHLNNIQGSFQSQTTPRDNCPTPHLHNGQRVHSDTLLHSSGRPENNISINVDKALLRSCNNDKNTINHFAPSTNRNYPQQLQIIDRHYHHRNPTYQSCEKRHTEFSDPSLSNCSFRNDVSSGDQNTQPVPSSYYTTNTAIHLRQNHSHQVNMQASTSEIQIPSFQLGSDFMSPPSLNHLSEPTRTENIKTVYEEMEMPIITNITSLPPEAEFTIQNSCHVCGKSTQHIMWLGCCKRCYCSSPCKRKDWKNHKIICKRNMKTF